MMSGQLNLPKVILIASHTGVQMDLFIRKHRLSPMICKRVRDPRDFRGWNNDTLLLLLPEWERSMKPWEARDLLMYWDHAGGQRISIKEEVVLGMKPLCENDKDGDGNCHLCVRKGGCQWPKAAEPPDELEPPDEFL